MARQPGQKTDKGGEIKLFGSIADSLKQTPAYLLVFGVILFTYLYCTATLVTVTDKEAANLRTYSLFGLLFETFMVAVIVVLLEGQKARRGEIVDLRKRAAEDEKRITELQEAMASADRSDINIGNEQARKCLAAVIKDVRDALNFDNRSFHAEVVYKLDDFRRSSARWADGILVTDAGDYERILRDFYGNALHSVFATSNEGYMDFWASRERAGQVIRAHRAAFEARGTTVVRVFVFSSIDQVTGDYLRVIQEHASHAFIRTRIFFADENGNPAFNEHLTNDFVIIDQGRPSQAIGITSSFEPGLMGAKWVFDQDSKIERTSQWIVSGSISVADLEARLTRREAPRPTD